MRRNVSTIKHITKIINNTNKSMVDYANEALKGVRIVTAKYASA